MVWIQTASLKEKEKLLKDFSVSISFTKLLTSLLDKLSLGNYVDACHQSSSYLFLNYSGL